MKILGSTKIVGTSTKIDETSTKLGGPSFLFLLFLYFRFGLKGILAYSNRDITGISHH